MIAFLSRPETYSSRPEKVERIDTHGAMVFLAGDMAVKIKKPVHFPYMDFSTLEKRHVAIAREYEINAPHAPRLYRKIVPITRSHSGRLGLGGNGDVVEWALLMRRFGQNRLLSAMADAGALDREIMARLAKSVVRLHQGAAVNRRARFHEALKTRVRHNEQACREYPDLFDPARVNILFSRCHTLLEQQAEMIRARVAQGHVRRCHGDLHLRNIVMLEDGPTPFDAIEFDEKIATTDILDDLAFLLMDLVERKLQALANQVLNTWLGAMNSTAHYEALALLPLYLSSRAGIRAKVMLPLMNQPGERKGKEARKDAISYFETAGALVAPSPPRLIGVGGLSGSGKTTLARLIAPFIGTAPGAVCLRSDVIRKRLMGVEETTRLPGSAYAPKITQRVYELILERASAALAAGHSVVADAVHARESERLALENLARKRGVPFHGLWLDAPEDILMQRVSARRGDASDADRNVVARQLEHDVGRLDWPRIEAAQNSQVLARKVLERVIGIEPTTFSLGS